MGFDVSDLSRLGPSAQRQVFQQMGKKQIAKGNKLHNKKCRVSFRGESKEFDSEKEGRRWLALRAMECSGAISNLRCQVVYELIPKNQRADGTTERACKYIADFAYVENGVEIVEDVKGYKNPASATYAKFVIKRKLMLDRFGITVREV